MQKLEKDLATALQEIANKHHALLLSFIAPDKIVRKSPVLFDTAQITVSDLYNIEKEIEHLKEVGKLPKKVHFVIQTPGGALDASIKIATYLQAHFSDIEAYVPYEAASGGTLLCFAAKYTVMDFTSSLTPIDPQVGYKNQWISATSYGQAIANYQKEFGNFRHEEIPSPYQQLCSQLDPVIEKEMDKIVYDAVAIAYKLLINSQHPKIKQDYDKLFGTALAFAKTNYPHSHVITAEEAKELGLNINQDNDKLEVLKVYKKWVSSRLQEEETTHIIESFYPEKEEKYEKTNTEAATAGSKGGTK